MSKYNKFDVQPKDPDSREEVISILRKSFHCETYSDIRNCNFNNIRKKMLLSKGQGNDDNANKFTLVIEEENSRHIILVTSDPLSLKSINKIHQKL